MITRRRWTTAGNRQMTSIASALLLVIAIVSATNPARAATSRMSASPAASPSRQDVGVDGAIPDAGWRQAVRTEVARTVRPSVTRRDATDRREHFAGVGPAWITSASTAVHACLGAGLAMRRHVAPRGVPGLPAPSSRAPPIV